MPPARRGVHDAPRRVKVTDDERPSQQLFDDGHDPFGIRHEIGGDTLEIGFEKAGESSFKNVTLTGPADFVFEGEIDI